MRQEFFVQWHLTERCNLACRHCYQRDAGYPELSSGQILEYLREIKTTLDDWTAEYGLGFAPSVHFTGGEPVLFDGFRNLAGDAVRLGYRGAVMTNGTLVNETIARQLAETGLAEAQVSLEGLEKTHDSIRGRGTFANALAGAAHLQRAGLTVNFNVTLSRINAEQVETLVHLAASTGVSRIGFARLVPSGRGGALAREMLGGEELRAVYARLNALDGSGVTVTINDPLTCLCGEDDDRSGPGEIPLGGCAAGIGGITVMPDGTVMPCRRMELPIGNLQQTSFRELWVGSPVLENLRNRHHYSGRCGRCRFWSHCRGCRAVARATASGPESYLADDPQCWLTE
ncbi:radical SAM/SPASM domain-containing protein [Desulfotomaculum copahuensis]|uniref:Radical SAM core domain-containing protein n=1 Tax=Desulfotomaculum copahuensis TaxID=1838280 RepID=A0A1B7LFA6_9FIRM|nr:radical SAM protein [Desulfotomaculum copahuensis]OAT82272.1 hypothetical protein A6M21_08925 [Desulfotomaculum copahuensis]